MSTGSVKAILISFSLAVATALAGESAQPRALRVVHDASRNQVWVLGHDAVYLHDATSQALKGRFVLPDWAYLKQDFACAPDLAVDAKGGAVISSNATGRMWRIDPQQSEVTMHEVVPDADRGQDFGFTGLVYAADQGAFFAASTTGSLWRIDPLLRRAQKIPLSAPLRDACGLALERTKTRRTLVLCARTAESSWALHLTPDQRSAYLRREACGPASSEL
jgi:hypothetical protein